MATITSLLSVRTNINEASETTNDSSPYEGSNALSRDFIDLMTGTRVRDLLTLLVSGAPSSIN